MGNFMLCFFYFLFIKLVHAVHNNGKEIIIITVVTVIINIDRTTINIVKTAGNMKLL